MKQAVLAVSFGTSFADTREKTIGAVEQHLAAESGLPVFSAYTSAMVRRALAKQNVLVPSPEEALEQLCHDGYGEIFVLPTHLLYGGEHQKLLAVVDAFRPRFSRIAAAEPLLADEEDIRTVAEGVCRRFPKEDGQSVLLMGHGADSEADRVYQMFTDCCRSLGRKDLWVGTVMGHPQLQEVLPELQKSGDRTVLLAPLMLAAGAHAQKDMAGDHPESWKSRLAAAGFSVSCRIEGLGQLPEVRRLYGQHLKNAMERK
ncbi:MAG: sirohydrochlorin cobaltochelatase [Oscillospiraceae bacterium]|nr:sirohydrochlorin cobaltochelatase [Oscillospiraceae bacterium]